MVHLGSWQKTELAKTTYGFKRPGGYSRNKKVNWNTASDHGAFARYNIPYIYYGVGTHENYHTINDTFVTSNLPLLLNNTRRIHVQLQFLDKVIDQK